MDNKTEENSGGEEEVRKVPEFIYVETGREHQREPFEELNAGLGNEFQQMSKEHFPFFMRLFCLTFSGIAFLACLLIIPFLLFFFLVNVITLFKAEELWSRTKIFWGKFKKLFVSGMGLFIAVFSPSFGFAVIMIYMMITGGKLDENWMARIMRQRMKRK